MRNPNGYGTVYKLSGNRRKPFIARVTVGWKTYDRLTKKTLDCVPDNCDPFEVLPDGKMRFTDKQIYQTVGCYATRQDAMIALAEYNADPFDLHISTMTLEELYDKWSDEHFPKVSHSNVQGVKASWKLLQPLKGMRLVDIKLDHYQKICDESGKNSPTLKKLKITLGLMYDYAVKHEFLKQDKRDMIRYIDIKKAGNPNALNRKPFSKAEVNTIWKWKDSSPYIKVILMLIYSGCRIGEFLDLKKENVNLEQQWFDITASKTEAGIRKVPINDKVLPFFIEWYNMNDSEYLISSPDGKHLVYRNYYDSYWKPFMEQMNMEHRPHDTRHTCISLLSSAGVDERFIKKIVGHKGQGVTETVYTHLEIKDLIEAINKIQV